MLAAACWTARPAAAGTTRTVSSRSKTASSLRRKALRPSPGCRHRVPTCWWRRARTFTGGIRWFRATPTPSYGRRIGPRPRRRQRDARVRRHARRLHRELAAQAAEGGEAAEAVGQGFALMHRRAARSDARAVLCSLPISNRPDRQGTLNMRFTCLSFVAIGIAAAVQCAEARDLDPRHRGRVLARQFCGECHAVQAPILARGISRRRASLPSQRRRA